MSSGDGVNNRSHRRVCVLDSLSEWQIANAEVSTLISSNYSADRILALEDIYAEAGALVMLDDMLKNDPESRVRVAVLEKLDESDSTIAHESILKALEDKAPEVVLTALEIIDYWGDEDVIFLYVAALTSHPDADVRHRVNGIISKHTPSPDRGLVSPAEWRRSSGIDFTRQ